jgi:hypothetical protein
VSEPEVSLSRAWAEPEPSLSLSLSLACDKSEGSLISQEGLVWFPVGARFVGSQTRLSVRSTIWSQFGHSYLRIVAERLRTSKCGIPGNAAYTSELET